LLFINKEIGRIAIGFISHPIKQSQLFGASPRILSPFVIMTSMRGGYDGLSPILWFMYVSSGSHCAWRYADALTGISYLLYVPKSNPMTLLSMVFTIIMCLL
jgi:hypothetical protein